MPAENGNLDSFIPLDRTFHELSIQAHYGDEATPTQTFSEALSWDDLLQLYRVVILSEAGSGKTQEIRHAAQRLRCERKDAFFLRLENIPQHFDLAFEGTTLSDFEHWLASEREGWVFLDSVDEARLRHPLDFELAIQKLGAKLALALDRTHIILTGRMSAWRPKTDLERCTRYLPFAPAASVRDDEAREDNVIESDIADEILSEGEDAEGLEPSDDRTVSTGSDWVPASTFKIVTLDDLSKDQVAKFVANRGVANTFEFADEIERADANAFTSRPQDLQDLIASWQDKKSIGGRLQIMRNSVERRLRERDQNRADSFPLSPQLAYDGALLLAAATTLGNNPSINVPDGTESGLKGIDVRAVLPDWNEKAANALLQRPIFDEPIYGAQRFHHRSVREYLTAVWLCRLLEQSASRRSIESLFFQNQYGVDIVVPAMRPVLPWMALFDPKILKRVQSVAPEVLFEGGDPAQLPPAVRKKILETVTAEIAVNATSRSPTDRAAVQRFADRRLGPDIRRLLQTYADNEDAASFLLRMVWLGRVAEALPEAKQQALASGAGVYLRIAALRAVDAIGDAQDMREIRESILAEPGNLSRNILSEMVSLLRVGEGRDAEWLLRGVEKTAPYERYTVDYLGSNLLILLSGVAMEALPRFVQGFSRLLSKEPYKDRHYRISKRFAWLLEPAAKAVERLAEARHPAALTADALKILRMLHGSRHFDQDGRTIKSNFAKLVPAWPELNRASFWSATKDALDGVSDGKITYAWQVGVYGSFWSFSAQDFDYFLAEIGTRASAEERLIALSLAFDAYVQGGRQRQKYTSMKKIVAADRGLSERLDLLLNPPPRSESTILERRWKRESAARERREQVSRAKAQAYIKEHLAELRDPKFPNPNDLSKTQWYLHHQMRDRSAGSGKWTSGNWQSLVPDFGQDVAMAFRDGAVAYWRRANPSIRSEGTAANATTAGAIFGLTGLAIEAKETPNWAQALNEDQALRASRFASHELNGFPTWLPSLYAAHPKVVGDFLLRELEFELRSEPEEGMHYIIDDLSWSGRWAWPDLGSRVFEILNSSEPRNNETLDKLMQIVLASEVSSGAIADLAATRLQNNTKHVANWFAFWARVSPAEAISALDEFLVSQPTDHARTQLAMAFITRLFGDRYQQNSTSRDAYRVPAILKDLYVMMHRYIRRSEDVDRANGEAYSPTLRDRAQDARDSILRVLIEIAGKEAYLAMMQIADNEANPSTRVWIRYRAHQKAEQDGNIEPWTAEQVREFHDCQERTPRNHRELAELALNRLLDLKADLEDGDSSVATILSSVKNETEMRIFIGRELRQAARGRYSIPQEEELADARRPDLRFHRSEIDGPVPVELKLAENWTGSELLERMENQLSGAYLRDRRSSRGIYLLVHRGGKRQWTLNDTSKVNFAGLVQALQNHWKVLSPSVPEVDDLYVIGIDLTTRSARRH